MCSRDISCVEELPTFVKCSNKESNLSNSLIMGYLLQNHVIEKTGVSGALDSSFSKLEDIRKNSGVADTTGFLIQRFQISFVGSQFVYSD